MDLVPSEAEDPVGQLTPGANVASATCAAMTHPEEHDQRRQSEEEEVRGRAPRAPRLRARPTRAELVERQERPDQHHRAAGEDHDVAVESLGLSIGRSSADRAGVAFPLEHHGADHERDARRASRTTSRSACRRMSVSSQPSAINAGHEAERQVDLLPREAERPARAASRRANFVSAICSRHDDAVEREQRRDREEMPDAPRARVAREVEERERRASPRPRP